MIFIGERINAGFKDIREAVQTKNKGPIQDWARKQTAAKADYLDVCLGTASSKPEDLCWMIESVQEVVDTAISIDMNKIDLLKEALKVCKKPPLINSVTAIDAKMDVMFPLVKQYNASIICLVMDERGSPKTSCARIENAGKVFAKAMEHGVPTDHIFMDPIIMPLKHMQDQGKEILAAVAEFKNFSDPPCHIVCGLSNASNGTVHKKLINRTFATMLVGQGLDAMICDVNDTDLVDAALTAELVMNKSLYADSYIEAFRK